jgi:hypothetical protein
MKIFSKGKAGGAGDGAGKPVTPVARMSDPRKVERPQRAPARPEGGQMVRPPREPEREVARGEACAIIDWLSVGSVREIDSLIAVLRSLCDELYVEQRRVQRELADFARVSDAAMETTSVIVETLGQWRSIAGRGR